MAIFGLNIWEFLAAIVNFIILLWLLKKFLYTPILKMLEDRKKAINEALDAADAARMEVAATEEKLREEIACAHAEAKAIIEEAKKQGEDIANKLAAAAKEQAELIAAEAAERIELEKRQAIIDLKNEIGAITILAMERLIGQGLTAAQEKNLMDQYIKEIGRMQ